MTTRRRTSTAPEHEHKPARTFTIPPLTEPDAMSTLSWTLNRAAEVLMAVGLYRVEPVISHGKGALGRYTWSPGTARPRYRNGVRDGYDVRPDVRRLKFSKHYIPLSTRAQTNEVILHEVAHALTEGHHHDACWMAQYRALGGTGGRLAPKSEAVTAVRESAAWRGVATCGCVFNRHRLSASARNGSCPDHRQTITWSRNI